MLVIDGGQHDVPLPEMKIDPVFENELVTLPEHV
jgi:hypothetical protein